MKRERTAVLALATVFACVTAAALWADWQPDGTPVCTAIGLQDKVEMIPDGAGGAFLVWQDARGGDNDIYAQRIDFQGNALWTNDGLIVCDAPGSQTFPRLISDGSGGVITAWQDCRASNCCIYAQRLDADSDTLWAANGVNICSGAGSGQSYPWLISDGAGGAFLTWRTFLNLTDIYAQHIDSLGETQWAVNGVPVCTDYGHQYDQIMVPDGEGGMIVCWRDHRAGYFDIYAQRIDSLGAAQWTVNGVAVTDTTGGKIYLDMISDGYGGAIIVWDDDRIGGNNDIYAQRIDHDGNPVWQRNGVGVCVALQPQLKPVMVPADGGAIVAWEDNRGFSTDIYARKITLAGDTLWDANGVALCTVDYHQSHPCITTDGADGAIVAWMDRRSGGEYNIYAQRIDASGAIAWTHDGVPVCLFSCEMELPRIASDGAGGAIASWRDSRDYGSNGYDIYASGVDANGDPKTPTLLSNFTADVSSGGVVISWTLSEAGKHMQFYILRGEGAWGDYRRLEEPAIDRHGLSCVFTDNDCSPGKTYRYRVDVSDSEGYRTLFETAPLTLPAAALRLEQNTPNPFNPSTTIRFYLPARGRVQLNVFDTAGRLVATPVDGIRPAGWNSIVWNATNRSGRRLSSGVYLYRLKAGKRTLTRKMTVLK